MDLTARYAKQLGIRLTGEPHIDWSMTVYLRIPDLMSRIGKAYRYVFVGPEGTWSFLTIVNGKDLWRLQIVDLDESRLQSTDIPALVRRCMGRDVPFTIEDSNLGSASVQLPTASWMAACSSPVTPRMRIRRTGGSA